MWIGNEGVGDIDDCGFGGPGEDLVGVRHKPLVELILTSNQNRERRLASAPRSTSLLPHGRDRAGEARQDTGIEAPDVDSELEGVRCDYRRHGAVR